MSLHQTEEPERASIRTNNTFIDRRHSINSIRSITEDGSFILEALDRLKLLSSRSLRRVEDMYFDEINQYRTDPYRNFLIIVEKTMDFVDQNSIELSRVLNMSLEVKHKNAIVCEMIRQVVDLDEQIIFSVVHLIQQNRTRPTAKSVLQMDMLLSKIEDQPQKRKKRNQCNVM